MLALAIIIRTRHISLLPPISIDNENSLEDSSRFVVLNKSTKEVMDNIRKSKKLSQILEPTSIKEPKIVKKNIHIEEFISTEEWKGPKVLELKRSTLLLFKNGKQVETYNL